MITAGVKTQTLIWFLASRLSLLTTALLCDNAVALWLHAVNASYVFLE